MIDRLPGESHSKWKVRDKIAVLKASRACGGSYEWKGGSEGYVVTGCAGGTGGYIIGTSPQVDKNEISCKVTIGNRGWSNEEYKVKLYVNNKLINTEPDSYWKNVDSKGITDIRVSSKWKTGDIKGKASAAVELWSQKAGKIDEKWLDVSWVDKVIQAECDKTHWCSTGYKCVYGSCVKEEGAEPEPGATGVCPRGRQYQAPLFGGCDPGYYREKSWGRDLCICEEGASAETSLDKLGNYLSGNLKMVLIAIVVIVIGVVGVKLASKKVSVG